MTLGGLLALGYIVVVSYKRASTSVNNGQLSMSFEYIDTLDETFMVLKGTDRKVCISCNVELHGCLLETSFA